MHPLSPFEVSADAHETDEKKTRSNVGRYCYNSLLFIKFVINRRLTKRQKEFQVCLSVASLYEKLYVRLPKLFSVKGLPIVCPPPPSTETLKRWCHVSEQTSKEVMLLIEVDLPEVFWSLEDRCGKPDEPYAIRTVLGWSLIGLRPDSNLNFSVNHVRVGDELLGRQVATHWQLEATPITATN